MPRVNKHTARKNLYRRGLRTAATNKRGYSLDRSKPADENDTVMIKAGQVYYHWKFKRGGEFFSLTYPKRQQLTQSYFLQTVYDIEDGLSEWTYDGHGEDGIEDIKTQIEELRDETQGSLDNMPYQLQESETGQLLQERIDGLEEMLNELEALDFTEVESEDDEEAREELKQGIAEIVNNVSFNA